MKQPPPFRFLVDGKQVGKRAFRKPWSQDNHVISLTELSLRLPHTSRFFCRRSRTADFLSGSNRVKICRAISLPNTSRFFVATTRVEAWSRVLHNQDGAYSTHVTLTTFPNWLSPARAPTNCLGPPHTSRQGPTRRFEI